MSEQLEILLETINVGLAPIMQSISELTGYSSNFIKENFDLVFYQAGQYLFVKSLMKGYGFYFIMGWFFGGVALLVYSEYHDYSFSKGVKIFLGVSAVVTIFLFLLVTAGDIILYNTAREAWILDEMTKYIKVQ